MLGLAELRGRLLHLGSQLLRTAAGLRLADQLIQTFQGRSHRPLPFFDFFLDPLLILLKTARFDIPHPPS
ncbi:MAG: hypothetical protein NVSMB9_34500 [Isosphaeraceae bacterium]